MCLAALQTIFVHGYSRVVCEVLLKAARKKHFSVIVTEGRPDDAGYTLCAQLEKAGVPVTMVLDSAMGCVLPRLLVRNYARAVVSVVAADH